MRVVDIANEIYIDSGSPTSTSIPAIAYWIRGKVGEINNLLFEDFSINAAMEIVDGDGEISIEAVSIIKKLYKIYDYEVSVRTNMNALAADSIIEVVDQGSSVRKVNRNEVSKTFVSLRNAEEESLNRLVTAYRSRTTAPTQVVGDDTEIGYNAVRGYTVRDITIG
jgi:hypothetical protein